MNKIKYIAICDDPDEFKENKIIDSDYAKKYPGSSWVPFLGSKLKTIDVLLVTGDVAYKNITDGNWRSKDVAVIQLASSKIGENLCNKGAKPFVYILAESLLWVPHVYKNIATVTGKYKTRIMFSGVYDWISTAKSFNDKILNFPSVFSNKYISNKKWSNKKFLVAVFSNKYHISDYTKIEMIKPLKTLSRYYNRFRMAEVKYILKHELQTERYRALEYFYTRRLMDLYGTDWDNLNNIEPVVSENLLRELEIRKPRRIENKLDYISNYKFSLVYENIAFPGYVTEKIIETISAGVVPIYYGAPDIKDYLPGNIYIHMREFNDYQALEKHIKSIDEHTYSAMIEKGRMFLESDEGYKYTYEYFSDKIFQMFLESYNPSI